MRRLLGSMLLGATLLAMVATSVALAAAPAAVAAVVTQPKAGPGDFGVRLVDIPVVDVNNPRGLRYIIDYLHTGTTIHRRILVKNEETRKARLTVYPDAAEIGNEVFTGEAGATRSELTEWISVQHPVLNLAPGASEMDMVTINVPLGATRGEHYGEIWVQQESYAHAANGFGINEVVRVGIRIYLAVGQGGAPPTAFAIGSMAGSRSAKGQPLLVVHLNNTGGRAVDLSGTAGLTGGPGGSSAGPFRSQQVVTLAPGQSGTMTFAPPKSLPDGPWQAKVTVVSGITTSVATGTVHFGTVAAGGIHLSLMAWGGLVLAGVALLGGLTAFLVRRHALRDRQPALV